MLNKLIKERHSPVLFSDKKIEKEILLSLFEAARQAPSSFNQQPWRYIIGTRKNLENFNLLYNCLAEGNKTWTKNVPVLGLSIAEVISLKTGKPNKYAFHDVGLSLQNLIIQGMSVGVFTHVMGGFSSEKAKTDLAIPDGFEPVAMFALGYPAESTKGFDKELIERENKSRERKPVEDFLFFGGWGVK